MAKFWDVDQGTAAWYKARLGKPTASKFHKIITPKTGKLSAQSAEYGDRLLAERLLQDPMDDQRYVEAMEHGKENEPYAAAQFELVQEVELLPVGFITTDDDRIGCSPDRLIKGKRQQAVEIKCPYEWTQIGRLRRGMDAEYKPQVQGQLFVGEFETVHFYSWRNDMPAYHLETARDEQYIRDLADALERFCDQLDEDERKLRSLGAQAFIVRPTFQTPLEKAYPELTEPQYEIKLP